VYDIMNNMDGAEAEKEFEKQFASKGFHDTSTEQMLRVSKAPLVQEIVEQKHRCGDDDESSMELDEISAGEEESDSEDSDANASDEDMIIEGNTHEMTPSETTTGSKARKTKELKRPLIEDITEKPSEATSMK